MFAHNYFYSAIERMHRRGLLYVVVIFKELISSIINEPKNNNNSTVPLLLFQSRCKIGWSFMCIYIFSYYFNKLEFLQSGVIFVRILKLFLKSF